MFIDYSDGNSHSSQLDDIEEVNMVMIYRTRICFDNINVCQINPLQYLC